jgi:phosphate transport system substrate-binding protein
MITAEVPGGVRQSYVVTANGSGKAFKAIGARNADIGMSSRLAAEDEVEQLKGLGDMRSRSCEHIIALDGIAIVVNEGNQVKQLDRSQVSEIFQGKITDWSAVGGRPGPIQLYARNKDSGTGKDFAGMVLGKGAAISAAARVKASGDEIAAAVSSDPGGIGYVAIAQVNGVKALAISDGTGSTALAPSPFTVLTEDYVLSRRLYLYAPGSPADFANKLITFANTAEGQEVVKKTGFVQQTPELMPSPDIPASAPVEYREHIAGKQRININFRFESNGKALDNKAEADIDRVVKFLQARNVRQGVYLPGFADSEGGHSAQNCALSLERAQAVKDILFSSGINATVGGLCDDLPVGDNATDAGRRKNRRVEVWIP